MLIADAQRDVRSTFLGGFVGQLVSAVLWAVSAALATWGRPRQAIIILVVGGFFIFPATQLGLRLLGRTGRLAPSNPFGQLGMQVAFTLTLSLRWSDGRAVSNGWFYPAFAVLLGAHYLPVRVSLRHAMFLPLGGVLVAAGFAGGRLARSVACRSVGHRRHAARVPAW
jgi:hypothetical protein